MKYGVGRSDSFKYLLLKKHFLIFPLHQLQWAIITLLPLLHKTWAGIACLSNSCMHGVCIDFNNSSYGCYCEDGYTGYQCQTNWDECWSQPCQNGATCLDLIARFECICLPGFTGHLCNYEVNECLSNPCLNNGTCIDMLNRYECECMSGFKGDNCEIDISICNSTVSPEPKCQNNGVCIDGPGMSFNCLCPPGWMGRICEIDRNECEDSICNNGGVCNNIPGDFLCHCPYGFTGRICESEVIPCLVNYCENNALCFIESGHDNCYCVPDFHGALCQYRYNDCLPYSPRCMNGGTCIDGVDSFQCSCPSYTSGFLCECRWSPEGEEICKELPTWFEDEKFHPTIVDIFHTGSVSIYTEHVEATTVFSFRKDTFSTFLYDHTYSASLPFIDEVTVSRTYKTEFKSVIIPTLDIEEFKSSDILKTRDIEEFKSSDILKTRDIEEFKSSDILKTRDILYSTITFTEITDKISITDKVFATPSVLRTPADTEGILISIFTRTDYLPLPSASIDVTPTLDIGFLSVTVSPTVEILYSTTLPFLLSSFPIIPSEIYSTFVSNYSITYMATIPPTTFLYDGVETIKPSEIKSDITTYYDKTIEEFTSSSVFDLTSTSVIELDIFITTATSFIPSITLQPSVVTSYEGDFDGKYITETKIPAISDYYVDDKTVKVDTTSEFVIPYESELKKLMNETVQFLPRVTITVFEPPISVFELPFTAITSLTTSEKSTIETKYPMKDSMEVSASILATQLFPDRTISEDVLFTSIPTAIEEIQISTPTIFLFEETAKRVSDIRTDFALTSLEPSFDVSLTVVNYTLISTPVSEPFSAVIKTISEGVLTDFPKETATITEPLPTYSYTDKIEATHFRSKESLATADLFNVSRPEIFVTTTDIVTRTDETTFTVYPTEYVTKYITTPTSIGLDPRQIMSVTQIDSLTTGLYEDYSVIYTATPPIALPTLIAADEILIVPKTLTVDMVLSTSHIPTVSKLPAITPSAFVSEYYPSDITTTEISATTVSISNETTEYDFICWSLTCHNGGTCIVTSSGNICRCPFNYTGSSCDIFRYVSQTYFTGSAYLKTKIEGLSLREGVKIYIRFRSESPNGLLTYSEGNVDSFFMILLRNSLLQFVFSCGLQTVSFLQGNSKLASHSNTDILVRLWWTPYSILLPWGRGKCRASLQVNDSTPIYSEQESASSEVKLGPIYLGGLPSNYISPLVVKAGFLPRLRGCISLMEVNEVEIDIWLAAVEGENVEECGSTICPINACLNGGTCIPGIAEWSCVCVGSYTGTFCERKECHPNPCFAGLCLPSSNFEEVQTTCMCPAELTGPICKQPLVSEDGARLYYTGSFKGYSSYSSYKINFEHRKSISIRLHFTTQYTYQLGLLFYVGNHINSSKKDFFALALVRGYLLLTWDLGAGPRRIISSDPLDPTFHTHSVRAGRTQQGGWMEVNTQKNVSSYAPGFLSSLETNKILYLGGHPTWNLSNLPADLNKLEGFHGCIFDVRISEDVKGPWSKPKLLNSLGVGQCGKDSCSNHQCQNEAICQPIGAAYRCICTPGWKGIFCDVQSHRCANRTFNCSVGSSCIGSEKANPKLPKCLCPFGRVGALCEKDIEISEALFIGEKSFISLLVGNVLRKFTSISFEFKPLSHDGILVLALPHISEGDFLAIFFINKTLHLTYKLGNEELNMISIISPMSVLIGEWQNISLIRRGKRASLTFRGKTSHTTKRENILMSQIPNIEDYFSFTNELLDVQKNIFLGGGPERGMLQNAFFRYKKIPNFKGCIRKVTIGDIKYKLNNLEKDLGILKGQGIVDCDGTTCGIDVCANNGVCIPDNAKESFYCNCTQNYTGRWCETPFVCFNHKCKNNGKCEVTTSQDLETQNGLNLTDKFQQSIDDSYICLCPPSKSGLYCEKSSRSSSANFRGKSYAVVHQGIFLAFTNPLVDNISLNFSTFQENGLILWKGYIKNEGKDYIGLGLSKGRLKLVWHLGGENVGIISTREVANDGKWHSVSIYRKEKFATLFFDGSSYKSISVGDFVQLNSPNTFYLGGFPENVSVRFTTDFHFTKSFIGCLKDVILHPLSFVHLFSNSKEGLDLQPCSITS